MFGKEHHLVKVNVTIDPSVAFACFEEEWWECAHITDGQASNINTYSSAVVDLNKDLTTVNAFNPAELVENTLANKPDAYVSVDLDNLKTGTKYIDEWFDVRLYNKEKQEHPYDKMYVRLHDYF